jgi:hypothetical protein
MNQDRALRGAAIAIVLALAAIGAALPGSLVLGGCAWLACLCFALSGWGWLVSRALGVDDVDFGLRAMWGVAGYLAAAGVLVMLGVCSRPVTLVLVGAGLAGFGWREWVTPAPLWQSARTAAGALRARPVVATCAIVLGAAVALQIVASLAHLDRNPWDDDVAYTPFVQRLLQAGNLIEPFSFRRLAAYGGQTVLQAMVGARGSIVSVHALDHGLCFALLMLLLVGHARERRVPGFWLGAITLVLVLSPDVSINTASYWSGAVCFYALYRTVALADSPRGFAVAALVAAATCTLRMNYLAAVVPFLAIALAFRARGRWREELRAWRLAVLVGIAALVPWCIASFLSNHTFLYPFMQGTWNHGLHLQPTAWSWLDELGFLFTSCIQSEPIAVMPVVLALLWFARDTRTARPLTALLFASVLGFLLLAHSFTSADSYSIWRYAFGYMFALLLAFAVEGAVEDGPVAIVPLARWTLLAVLLVQLAFARTGVVKHYVETFQDLAETRHAAPESKFEARRYRAMQAAIPEGARVAVMLDDAEYLDFRRNEIVNLDTPGWASPAPQMPSFTGPEAMRAYFLDQGIRYIAFVRGDQARYFFRREFWVWRVFYDAEVFQIMSSYLLDTIDTFTQLATTSKVLHDADGLVVLDLDGPHESAPRLDPAAEPDRRYAFVRALAEREHLLREWSLISRRDVIFEEGVTAVTYPDTETDPHWYDVVYRDDKPVHGTPLRWMHRRVHLRVRGDSDMHLVLRGRVNLNAVYTHPRLDVSLDGEPLASVTADDQGVFVVDVVVPRDRLDGWCDLYAILDTIGQPNKDVHDLKIARLEEVVWEPR